jgi:hypothetical protein
MTVTSLIVPSLFQPLQQDNHAISAIRDTSFSELGDIYDTTAIWRQGYLASPTLDSLINHDSPNMFRHNKNLSGAQICDWSKKDVCAARCSLYHLQTWELP